MAGYADVMKGIVNEANENVLDVVCGAYMCKVDLKDKVDEPAVITVDGMKYGTKRLLGKNVKCVTYDIAVYSCDEERARQGKKSWICIGAVPSAFGLLENELALIKTKDDAKNMVTMALAAGFDSAVGMVIKSMDIMSDADEKKFRDDIVTREEIMEDALDDITDEVYERYGEDDDDDYEDDEDDYDDRLTMRN